MVKDIPKEYPIEFILLKESAADRHKDIALTLCQEIFLVQDYTFDSISDTVSPSGVIAVCQQRVARAIANDKLLVLDRLQDPGNMGTIFRSCVAFGFYDIIGINCVDIYNPKVVRSSMGAIFKVNFVQATCQKALEMIADYDTIILDARGEDINSYPFEKEKTALILGNESSGVAQELKDKGVRIGIPMSGDMESLNAGIAISLAMYEVAKKSRGGQHGWS